MYDATATRRCTQAKLVFELQLRTQHRINLNDAYESAKKYTNTRV
jgi:hypothetical protein